MVKEVGPRVLLPVHHGAGWKDAMGSFNVNCYEFQFDLSEVIADINGQPGQDS